MKHYHQPIQIAGDPMAVNVQHITKHLKDLRTRFPGECTQWSTGQRRDPLREAMNRLQRKEVPVA